MWLFLLVSPFGEILIFPLSVIVVLDLYCEHVSSHLKRLFFSWASSNLIPRFLEDT